MGTFVALKPFYIRQSSTKDIEMCCCKLRLHAHWSINALLECCKLQSINLGPVKDYYSFFSYLSENCGKESTTHLSWECVSNKKTLCSHSQQKWTELVRALKESCNKTVTVTMYYVKKMPYKKKNGQIKKVLLYGPFLWMGFDCPKARATSRRQFTFYH